MYERFSDWAHKVMQLANQEAMRFNHEYIGTEHILLGLVKEGSGVAASVLKNLDIDLRKIRLEVERIVQPGPEKMTMGKLPQTERAKKVMEYAIEEAKGFNHNYVGTEHLLLGLVREGEGIAAQVIANLGVKLETIREAIVGLLKGKLPEDTTLNYNGIVFSAWATVEVERGTALPSTQHRQAGCPDDILRLAGTNPIVRECMAHWRSGRLKWDEALALAVVRLVAMNSLLADAAKAADGPGAVKPDTTVEGHNA